MSIIINNEGIIIDTRCCENKIFNHHPLSLSYTLLSDDITKGEKPSSTPYLDRSDSFEYKNGKYVSGELGVNMTYEPFLDGLLFELCGNGALGNKEHFSQFGINLPFNFMGKINGGGYKNQLLFNSPYISCDRRIIYAYLTQPRGNDLVVAILSEADGWKMDYSPYSFGHYFINLKLLSSYDKAYGTQEREPRLRFALLPVESFGDCLEKLSRAYNLPFLDYSVSGGRIGECVPLFAYGDIDSIVEVYNRRETLLTFNGEYVLKNEGETTLIPVKDGKRGAHITVYAYRSLFDLYRKSMKSIDLDIIKKYTDSNLCEHQCWASAALRFLLKYKDRLCDDEIKALEAKIITLLNVITETDETKAGPRITILDKPHGEFISYNVYLSKRVQELFFGITILLDAYKYFGEEKYLRYAKGATDCLINYYQGDDGRIEIKWGDKSDDYTTVCCPMIPLLDMASFFKDKNEELYKKYFDASYKMAEYLYKRGMSFPTEGCPSREAENEMEEGSISCTALGLLYFCKNGLYDIKYVKKAKEILDFHRCWIINTPIAQMKGSTLRWWETQWEGDADGPAICAGHAWTIWRAEADYLYYELTKDEAHLKNARGGFMTNLSKIQENGASYSIYNPDEINGGGFHSRCEEIKFQLAERYASVQDCGISRYVWIRINDTLLKNSNE